MKTRNSQKIDLERINYQASVVIPAYNEEKQISFCLDSLVRQATSRSFEVIVVDNNSSDTTTKVAKKYKEKLNLKVVFEKQKGRGAARRAGFEKAEGLLILSMDADTAVPDNWIERVCTTFTLNPEVSAVTGPCQISDCGFLTNSIFNMFQPAAMKLYRLFFGHYWLSGFNFAIRKSKYLEAGGFDPSLNALEDIDLSFKVSHSGKIIFLPDLNVVVSGRRMKYGLVKGIFPYIKTFIPYFWFKRRDVYIDDLR